MAKRSRQQRQSNIHSPARRIRTERNQLTDLIIHEKLVTTHTKAKKLQQKMDKLVTWAKKDTIQSRREVAKVLRNIQIDKKTNTIQKLFNDIAPKFKKRNGGYTRVLKYGNRKGDSSSISIITFIK